MDCAGVNRKDRIPMETIEKILDILNKNKIGITVIEEKNKEDMWYSFSIIAEDYIFIHSNGKGISKEFAMASAYAEFMERLQGQFIPNNILMKELDCLLEISNIVEFAQTMDRNNLQAKEIENFFENNIECRKGLKYYDLINDTTELLPEWIISNCCSSNGLCAGNTFEEAIVQGICELMERYVKQNIFLREIEVPTISKTFFKGLYSYRLIEEIEKNQLECIIKDCSFGGKFPVLGLIVLNKERNKVIFTLGSDLDIDICLQRCITEMFQGRELDNNFDKYMSSIGYNIVFQGNIDKHSKKHVFRTLYDNIGTCPINLLTYNEDKELKFKKAFLDKGFTNKEAFIHLVELIKNENKKVYIRDHSYLGFNTYRVYMPNVSEVKDLDEVILSKEKLDSIRKSILNIDKLSKQNLISLCNNINELRDTGLTYMTGAIRSSIPQVKDIEIFQDYKFLSLVYGYTENYGEAYLCLLKYLKNNKGSYLKNESMYNSILVYLDGKLNEIEDEVLKDICAFFSNCDDEFTEVIKNKNLKPIIENLPKCPICDSCNIKEKCGFNLQNFNKKIQQLSILSKEYSQYKIIKYIKNVYANF